MARKDAMIDAYAGSRNTCTFVSIPQVGYLEVVGLFENVWARETGANHQMLRGSSSK